MYITSVRDVVPNLVSVSFRVFVFQVYYPSKVLEYWVDPCLDFSHLGRHVWICLFVLKGSFLFSLRASCLQAQLSCIEKL